MGRRSAYPAAPQNVCDAVKRKDITCLPARSHAFNHEAKMLARKGIFARPSIAQPRIARKRQSRLILLFKQNPKHYTMKRKCLLARAFSRSRQWHIVRLSAARAAQPPILAAWQVSCDHYTTYSRFFKRCTHILTSSAPHPPNIRPCQPRQTALISSGSSPNYVLLFQRIVPICEYTL